MTEDQTTQTADEAIDKQPDEIDWQAKYEAMRQHSRDWEKQAKANKAAADELEQLKAAQMTEAEKLTARAEKAEAELAGMKAEAERVSAAQTVAKETDVPLELLMYCSTEDDMRNFANAYKQAKPTAHAAAKSSGSQIVRGDGAKPSNGDIFAQFAAGMLK